MATASCFFSNISVYAGFHWKALVKLKISRKAFSTAILVVA